MQAVFSFALFRAGQGARQGERQTRVSAQARCWRRQAETAAAVVAGAGGSRGVQRAPTDTDRTGDIWIGSCTTLHRPRIRLPPSVCLRRRRRRSTVHRLRSRSLHLCLGCRPAPHIYTHTYTAYSADPQARLPPCMALRTVPGRPTHAK